MIPDRVRGVEGAYDTGGVDDHAEGTDRSGLGLPPNTLEPFEVGVLRPGHGAVRTRGREQDAGGGRRAGVSAPP
jgi:hypothetical protein